MLCTGHCQCWPIECTTIANVGHSNGMPVSNRFWIVLHPTPAMYWKSASVWSSPDMTGEASYHSMQCNTTSHNAPDTHAYTHTHISLYCRAITLMCNKQSWSAILQYHWNAIEEVCTDPVSVATDADESWWMDARASCQWAQWRAGGWSWGTGAWLLWGAKWWSWWW